MVEKILKLWYNIRMGAKGKKISEESRARMSVAQKKSSLAGRAYAKYWFGKKHSEETRKKISLAKKAKPTKYWLGRKRSQDTISKIREKKLLNPTKYWLGKKRPDMSGERNPNWVNGSSKSPRPESRTSQYKRWRSSVLNRDGWQCLMPGCEHKDERLEVNHIKTYAKNPELSVDINNGITLCNPCHRGIRSREQFYENLFYAIVKN